jgi:hypothetical protein
LLLKRRFILVDGSQKSNEVVSPARVSQTCLHWEKNVGGAIEAKLKPQSIEISRMIMILYSRIAAIANRD